jgi:hypothetical protein
MRTVFLVAMILVTALLLLVVTSSSAYERYTWDGWSCDTYYESCVCYGNAIVFESIPPQYLCRGIEFCEDINRTVCR